MDPLGGTWLRPLLPPQVLSLLIPGLRTAPVWTRWEPWLAGGNSLLPMAVSLPSQLLLQASLLVWVGNYTWKGGVGETSSFTEAKIIRRSLLFYPHDSTWFPQEVSRNLIIGSELEVHGSFFVTSFNSILRKISALTADHNKIPFQSASGHWGGRALFHIAVLLLRAPTVALGASQSLGSSVLVGQNACPGSSRLLKRQDVLKSSAPWGNSLFPWGPVFPTPDDRTWYKYFKNWVSLALERRNSILRG